MTAWRWRSDSGLRLWLLLLLAWLPFGLCACQSAALELQGLAEQMPLDGTVLVTGGAFRSTAATGTFFESGATVAAVEAEAFALLEVLQVLDEGRVFHRVVGDPDLERRQRVSTGAGADADGVALAAVLTQARAQGADLVLVVEELRDGPIDALGVNSRWPVTFVSWILLGIGAVIPDHTFESRASLRVTLRDAYSGRVLADPVLVGGPIDLALNERGSLWGLVQSLLVPPFWVASDPGSVRAAVRSVVQRRLLVSLARELKSESVRQRLQERRAASLSLQESGGAFRVVVECAESLAVATLQARGLTESQVRAFESQLLAARESVAGRFRYEAVLPQVPPDTLVQLAVATLRGEVASATFAPRERR